MTDTHDIAALCERLDEELLSVCHEAKDAIERLARERDHYLSNWQEARQYLAIETQHAEKAEAERDALRAALEEIVRKHGRSEHSADIARAALQSTGEQS